MYAILALSCRRNLYWPAERHNDWPSALIPRFKVAALALKGWRHGQLLQVEGLDVRHFSAFVSAEFTLAG